MSIPVACQCGQRFMAQPHLAGQFVKCPVCGQGISVPRPAAPVAQHAPAAQYAAPMPAPVPYSRAVAPQRYEPAASGGRGPLFYVAIAGGVIVFFFVGALLAILIGYDVARSIFSGPSETAASSSAGSTSKPGATGAPSPAAPVSSSAGAPASVTPAPTSSVPTTLSPKYPVLPTPDFSTLPATLPQLSSAGADGLTGPVVIFQMTGFTGTGDTSALAKSALSKSPWFSGTVVVNQSSGEIVAGVRGSSVNTGPAKAALEAAGFKIGGTSYMPRGR